MLPWEKISKWVIGRRLSEKSEKKKLERQYQDVEEALKLITEVTKEPRTGWHSERPSTINGPLIPENRKPGEGSLRSFQRPNYERSLSSPAAPAFPNQKISAWPPCVTARDPNKGDLKRNYSCDNGWNFKAQPLPPMPEMTGFGRYRRAVNAPPEWQMAQLEKSLHDIEGAVVDHLGDCPPAGADQEIWRNYRAQHSRANSVASSHSSGSGGQTAASEYLDITTGTKVSRGFCASTTSSAASSFKDASSQDRRDSNISKASMTSPSSDGDACPRRRRGRGAPFAPHISRHASTASMSPLTAIREMQETQINPSRKIEKPCVFDEAGCTENALASDDDDEFDWSDMLEVGGGAKASNLTKRLERSGSPNAAAMRKPTLTRQHTTSQEKPKSRIPKNAVPDRSKTIKVNPRTSHVRFQVHRKSSDPEKTTSEEAALHNNIGAERPLLGPGHASGNKSQESKPIPENNAPPNLAGQSCSDSDHGSSKPEDAARSVECEQYNSDPNGKASLQSATSNETLFAGDPTGTNQLPLADRRQRSNTVCTVKVGS